MTEDPQQLKALALAFYKNLYSSEGVANMEAVLMHVPRKVSDEMNASLCAPYSENEVKIALFQMFPNKAPGPDGFPTHFYQRHWELCGKEVSELS